MFSCILFLVFEKQSSGFSWRKLEQTHEIGKAGKIDAACILERIRRTLQGKASRRSEQTRLSAECREFAYSLRFTCFLHKNIINLKKAYKTPKSHILLVTELIISFSYFRCSQLIKWRAILHQHAMLLHFDTEKDLLD